MARVASTSMNVRLFLDFALTATAKTLKEDSNATAPMATLKPQMELTASMSAKANVLSVVDLATTMLSDSFSLRASAAVCVTATTVGVIEEVAESVLPRDLKLSTKCAQKAGECRLDPTDIRLISTSATLSIPLVPTELASIQIAATNATVVRGIISMLMAPLVSVRLDYEITKC